MLTFRPPCILSCQADTKTSVLTDEINSNDITQGLRGASDFDRRVPTDVLSKIKAAAKSYLVNDGVIQVQGEDKSPNVAVAEDDALAVALAKEDAEGVVYHSTGGNINYGEDDGIALLSIDCTLSNNTA